MILEICTSAEVAIIEDKVIGLFEKTIVSGAHDLSVKLCELDYC